MEARDNAITTVITTAQLENASPEYNAYIERILEDNASQYAPFTAQSIVQIIRDSQASDGDIDALDVLALHIVDTECAFIIRLCACLSAEMFAALLRYGAVMKCAEAFKGIGALRRRITELVEPTLQMRQLCLA